MEIQQAQEQLVDRLASGWGLLTAGSPEHFNTMTIAWGQTGNIWWKPVFTAYVVPSRYTFGFMEESEFFTVSLFPAGYQEDLKVLGSKSGRDGDKTALTRLTPQPLENGVTFAEADLTLVCRKMLEQPLDPAAIPAEVMEKYYRAMGVHTMFIGEILEAIG